jgi:hypothetical protein
VVHYAGEDGQPALVIGYAPLEDGLNERVEVEVIEAAVTPVLFVRLHEDTLPGDDFNFPAMDGPLRDVDGRLPPATPLHTQVGSYLIAADQSLGEDGTVTLSLVVGPIPMWAVIYNDDEGQRDAVLGQTRLEPGIHRQVEIAIDPDQATGRLHAVLHRDDGAAGQFEFPDGADVPLTRNNLAVAVAFRLLSPAE